MTEWEVNAKQRIVDHFDLVAGTSTGGIIALGLGLGIPATDILKFYRSKDLSERRMGSEKALKLAAFLPSKVRASDASHGPAAVFQEKKLGHAKTRPFITTYDAVAGRIYVMKTAHHERFKYDYQQSAVEVALATSAAPTFFDFVEFEGHGKTLYLDGGV